MRKLLSCLVLILASSAALADSPFLNAMRFVPAQAFIHDEAGLVQFADVHASLASRGQVAPASWDELSDDSLLSALPANLTPDVSQYLLFGGPEYPELLGLDFFDIQATVDFGQPPEQAMLLLGDFDQESVTRAFSNRGYVAAGELLCPAAGCDTGTVVDFSNRSPGNPFGGALGRSFPVWSAAGVLAGSPSDSVVRQIAAVAVEESQSLAALPEVQALARFVEQWPLVASVTLVNPLALAVPTSEQLTMVAEQLAQYPLPPYSLAAYAAAADETHEYGLVTLVYLDGDQAAAAASALDARLAHMSSDTTGQPYMERLTAIGEVASAAVVPDEATGMHMVGLRIRSPIPGDPRTRSGEPFMRMLQGLYMRDALWLVPGG